MSQGSLSQLMTTAILKVLNCYGKWIKCLALLDTCATANFITESLARILQLPMQKCNIPISALNSLSTASNYSINLKIHSLQNNFSKRLQFLTIDHISDNTPSESFPRDKIKFPGNLPLADPEFHIPSKIDLLLGSGPTFSVFCIGQHDLSQNGLDLFMQKTRFGWTFGGSISISKGSRSESCNLITLEKAIVKFWELEEIDCSSNWSPEEIACGDHFLKNVTRNLDGRFVVALPFKANKTQLGESYSLAKKQLFTLKKRLNRNPVLKLEYSSGIQESIDLGHMSIVKNPDTREGFYMPHHAVFKESSSTTKTRIVLNGSAPSSTGVSLNDTLMVGPTIQASIFILHLRFRLHKIALTADIEKMYKQILVRPEDRKYQRILWYDKEDIVTLESNTVTFGESSAPYLAIRCLFKLADDEKERYPFGANVIKRDTYVDDLTTGAADIETARKIRVECTK